MKDCVLKSIASRMSIGLALSATVVMAGCGGGGSSTPPPPATAATPTISPAGGSFTSAQTVTITDSTAGATIYYTTDGSPPTTSSTKYSAAISVTATETISAMATASGDTASSVATASFTFTKPVAATPTFSPAGGAFTTAQSVTITDATAGAAIYYTTDGSTPTASSTQYSGAFMVSAAETVNAIATVSGDSNSAVGTASFTFTADMGTIVNVDNPSLYTNQVQIKNAASGLVLGISGQSQAGGANIIQETNTSSTDSMWHLVPNVYADGRFNLENMLTHELIGLSSTEDSNGLPSSAALLAGAQAGQYSDTGTDDEDWVFYLLTDGNYLIQNHYSGLYLQDDGSNTTSSATIDQGVRPVSALGCACQEWSLPTTSTAAYSMPLTVKGTGIYVHDPNMIQDPVTHLYWLYGTHQTIAYSTDLSTFTYTTGATPYGACATTQANDDWLTEDGRCADIGPDFASWTGLQSPPSDNNGGNTDVWAPNVMYAGGTYYQYYSIPVEPDPGPTCASTDAACQGGEAIIGLATSTSASGPWTDKGWIVRSWSNTSTPLSGFGFVGGTTDNAIDPTSFIDTAGNWWLLWGSWMDGMHMLQLDPSTGLPSTTNTSISNVAFRYWGEEGSFIYYWSGYYYYFGSINPCCSPTSTYRIVYGRSTSPNGPFLDRAGRDMHENGGTILLSTHSNIVGPGGEGVFTDTGSDGTKSLPTLVYHYYDGNNNGTPTLGINRLAFTSDGWPYVQ